MRPPGWVMGAVGGVRHVVSWVHDTGSARWRAVRGRYTWVRHLAEAWQRMQRNNGNQYAAAITYFSFLAIFPLLLLAAGVTGFVLHSHPAAQRDLLDRIARNVPDGLGQTLSASVKTFVGNRAGIGVVGLVGVLFTGLGWIGNLRAAVEVMWDRVAVQRNFFVARATNLLVLTGLGLGVLISIGLTVAGAAVTDQIVRALGWQDIGGVHGAVTVVGIVLPLLGDLLIFFWLLVQLPGVRVPRRIGVYGAIFAAVGFEVLKLLGTYTIARSAHSLTAGPFAAVIAVLIWIQLVARLVLYCAAWMAVLAAEQQDRILTE